MWRRWQQPLHPSHTRFLRPLRPSGRASWVTDPQMTVAGEACCNIGVGLNWKGKKECAFTGERVTFTRAEERCAVQNKQACTWQHIHAAHCREHGCCGENNCCAWNGGHYWSNAGCTVATKIDKYGKVAVAHNHTDWDSDTNLWGGTIKDSLPPSNINYFLTGVNLGR
jgi:hypothetical protein